MPSDSHSDEIFEIADSISILRALDVDDLIFGGSMEQPISDR